MNGTWRNLAVGVCVALLAAAAVISTSHAQDAQSTDEEGRVIRVAPDTPQAKDPLNQELQPEIQRGELRRFQPWLLPGDPRDLVRQARPASPYYIGVAAEEVDDALRAHVDLPDDSGLLVRMVFEGSPADEAGIKQYDIIVAADGEDLHELSDLIKKVDEHSGDQMTQFTLDVIRHGQPQTVWVTPAERPQPDEVEQPELGGGMQRFGPAERRMLEQLRQGRFGDRELNSVLPGLNLNQMPEGVSVAIEREGDGPPHITVERDGQKWEVTGDDPDSLEQLPEDLRPMVEGLLNGNTLDFGGDSGMERRGGDMQDRLDRMEQRMREMQQRFEEDRAE